MLYVACVWNNNKPIQTAFLDLKCYSTTSSSNLIQNWRLISLSTSSSPRIFLEKRFNFPLAISHPFYCSIESSGEPPFCYCRSWLHSSQLFVGNSEHIIGNDLWSKASVKSEFGVLDKVQLCDSEKKAKENLFCSRFISQYDYWTHWQSSERSCIINKEIIMGLNIHDLPKTPD